VRPVDPDFVLLPLTRDGRLADPEALGQLAVRLPEATDCFLFAHGWLYERQEARQEAARFFSLLDGALAPLRDRITPLRVAVHWPSKPFADDETARSTPAPPDLLRGVGDLARSEPGRLAPLLLAMAEAEVPRSPEEELELNALLRRLRQSDARGLLAPAHALSFWVMKRRAGEVGERLGREHLGPVLAKLGAKAPRLHLIGHSFGAKLVSSAVLGGLFPHSLTLLLGAFSAFAFAAEVPGTQGSGLYHHVLAEGRVRGRITVLYSSHDRALGSLYPAVTGTNEVYRADPGRLGWTRDVVARSALGAVGAHGVGAPSMDLLEAQRTGLPERPLVNVDGSRVARANEWLVGAHRDIYHPEIATLIAMAAGLLQGGADGPRPRPITPLTLTKGGAS